MGKQIRGYPVPANQDQLVPFRDGKATMKSGLVVGKELYHARWPRVQEQLAMWAVRTWLW